MKFVMWIEAMKILVEQNIMTEPINIDEACSMETLRTIYNR